MRGCLVRPIAYRFEYVWCFHRAARRTVGMENIIIIHSSNAQTYLLICEYIPTSRACIVMVVCSVYQSSLLIKFRLLGSCSEPIWGDAGCIAGNFRACMGLHTKASTPLPPLINFVKPFVFDGFPNFIRGCCF